MTRSDKGFTLLEVLVAFAITGVILTMAFRSFGTGVMGLSRSQELSSALALARAKLSAAGVEAPLSQGITSGRTEAGLYWRLEIRLEDVRTEDDAPGRLRTYWVPASVSRVGEADGAAAVVLRTIKLGTVR